MTELVLGIVIGALAASAVFLIWLSRIDLWHH